MKLLLDENLSPDLVDRLHDLLPELACVRGVELEGAADSVIWSYARSHGYAVVTKDADFAERTVLSRAAPKVIWIRLGNCSTRVVEMLLRTRYETIRSFLQEDEGMCLHLGSPLKARRD